ncbi:MAG: hypothetical protein E6R14_08930 [Thermomicrobiales bacterium]|nr:MAG: hypothetical protein E6R14_08930 [Thermomicrobiales bacterium]
MSQIVSGSALDHSTIKRRASPALHLAFGERWPALLEARGSFYLGDNSRRQTQRVNLVRPGRILAIDAAGNPMIYENACLHGGKRLITPRRGLHYREGETLQCEWHRTTYRADCGQLVRPGAMKIPIESLPERTCERSELVVWQNRLVFELGRDVIAARSSLELALRFIGEEAGDVFDFRDYRLQVSLDAPQAADMLTTLVNYLDIRHLCGHADTLGQLVDLSDYTHAGNPYAVVQRMGLHPGWLDGDSEWVKKYYKSGLARELRYGAVWVMTADGLMLEWYPGVIVVSQCLPDPGNPWRSTLHHDFYYHTKALPEFVAAHQKIFLRTGDEDESWCSEATDHLIERIADGRGDSEWGFLDPAEENYARWLYDLATARLMPTDD